MDITAWIEDLRGIKQIQFNFKQLSGYQVEVKIEDIKYTLSRAFRSNKFASTGSRLLLESLEKKTIRYDFKFSLLQLKICLRYFAVEFEQDIYVEEDEDKNCSNYVDDSYEACDRRYIQEILSRHYPDGFMPVWATDNMTTVTKLLLSNSTTFSAKYTDIILGIEKSGTKNMIP